MSDFDTKFKHSRKRNIMAKHLKDQGDLKGAFSLKVVDNRKEEYQRVKLKVTEVYDESEDD